MASFWEREFMLKNAGLDHNKPILFVTPTETVKAGGLEEAMHMFGFGPHSLYPFWLVLQLIYHIVALAVDGVQTGAVSGEPTGNYFLYVHNWAYLTLILSTMVDLAASLYVHCLAKHILVERDSTKAEAKIIIGEKEVKLSYKTMGKYYEMKWYLGVSWVFFTISSVVGVAVSLIYWILYITQSYLGYTLLGTLINENAFDFGTLAFTTLNAVMILVHVCISAKPFRLLHVYMPLILFLIYITLTLAYHELAGQSIYRVLDWDRSFLSTGLAGGFLLIYVPLVHLLVYALVQARSVLGRWCHIKYAYAKWKRKMARVQPALDRADQHGTNIKRNHTNDEELEFTQAGTQETVLSVTDSNLSLSRMGTVGSDHSDPI